MKQAAELLDSSQKRVDALLKASDAIIDHAGEFAGDSAEIIQQLRAMDLESRLGELNRKSAETQQLMDRQLNRLNETLDHLKERNSKVIEASDALKQEVTQAIQDSTDALSEQAQATQSEMRKISGESRDHLQRQLEKMGRTLLPQLKEVQQKQQWTLALSGASLLLLISFILLVLL